MTFLTTFNEMLARIFWRAVLELNRMQFFNLIKKILKLKATDLNHKTKERQRKLQHLKYTK